MLRPRGLRSLPFKPSSAIHAAAAGFWFSRCDGVSTIGHRATTLSRAARDTPRFLCGANPGGAQRRRQCRPARRCRRRRMRAMRALHPSSWCAGVLRAPGQPLAISDAVPLVPARADLLLPRRPSAARFVASPRKGWFRRPGALDDRRSVAPTRRQAVMRLIGFFSLDRLPGAMHDRRCGRRSRPSCAVRNLAESSVPHIGSPVQACIASHAGPLLQATNAPPLFI